MLNRRGFLTILSGALLAPDPEKLLWQPGKRLISIPSGRKLIGVERYSIWTFVNPAASFYSMRSTGTDYWGSLGGITSADVERAAAKVFKPNIHKRVCWAVWNDQHEIVSGEIHA